MPIFKSTSSESNKNMEDINKSVQEAKSIKEDHLLVFVTRQMLEAAAQFQNDLNKAVLEKKITPKEGKKIIDETSMLANQVKDLVEKVDYNALFDGMTDLKKKFQSLNNNVEQLPAKEQSSINFKAFFTAVESFFNKISNFILKSFNANDTASVFTKQTARTKSIDSDDSVHSLNTASTHSYASEESHNINPSANYRIIMSSSRNETVEEAVELELNVIDDDEEEENNHGFSK